MIGRLMRESRRYDVEPSANGLVIVDTWLNIPVFIPPGTADVAVTNLCRSMSRHAVRNALRWPTAAMIEAGGPGSEIVWAAMVEALV